MGDLLMSDLARSDHRFDNILKRIHLLAGHLPKSNLPSGHLTMVNRLPRGDLPKGECFSMCNYH